MRHTTRHLAEHPTPARVHAGRAHGVLAEYLADADQREEMALHALEAAVLPLLVSIARDWRDRHDYSRAKVSLSLSDSVIDNEEVPGVPDQVTVDALAILDETEAL